jgi:hypothetical protein
MRKINALLLLMLLASALAACSSRREEGAQAANLKASQPDEMTESAGLLIDNMAQGDFQSAARDFDDKMKLSVPPAKLRDLWGMITTQNGSFKKQIAIERDESPPYHLARVECQFERSILVLRVVFNSQKQVTGFFIEAATPTG